MDTSLLIMEVETARTMYIHISGNQKKIWFDTYGGNDAFAIGSCGGDGGFYWIEFAEPDGSTISQSISPPLT